MGCTQSKATNEAVIDGGKATKASPSAPIQSPEVAEQPELAASHTVSSDDHDVVAGTTNEGATDAGLKAKDIDNVKDETSTTENTETNDKTDKSSLEGTEITTAATTEKTVEDSLAKVASPMRSPRRSPRQRSSSSGVNEMAAMGKGVAAGVHKQSLVEPLLQPVVPKKVVSPPEPVVDLEYKKQPDMDNDDATPKQGEMEDLPVVPKEEAEKKEAVVNAGEEVLASTPKEVDTAPKDPTPAEETITPVKSKQEFTPIQRSSSTKSKYCAGCFMEETTPGAFKVCAKCKVVSYCGRNCQVQHWKVHKKACCKSSLDLSSSHLGESWVRSDSPSSVNSSGSFTEVDATMRKSDVHDDAVDELESVLRRLRSEESDNESNEKQTEETTTEEDAKPLAKDDLDPVETAREAILDETVAETLDGTTLDVAPRPSTPVADENIPIVQAPKLHTCVGCNSVEKASGEFKSCAKCRVVFYCNRKCQKGHWKEHKKVCCKSDPKRASLLQVKDPSLNPIQAS